MYFSDWAEDLDKKDRAKIEMSYMDGSNRTTIMRDRILWPNGLSLDLDENKLYFCDAFFDTIYQMDLSLSSRNVTVSLKLMLWIGEYSWIHTKNASFFHRSLAFTLLFLRSRAAIQ